MAKRPAKAVEPHPPRHRAKPHVQSPATPLAPPVPEVAPEPPPAPIVAPVAAAPVPAPVSATIAVFPKWLYHASGDRTIVANQAAQDALGPGWSDTPPAITKNGSAHD